MSASGRGHGEPVRAHLAPLGRAHVTLSWSELRVWVGVSAQVGRIVPKGFPRSNSFGPAF